MALMIVASMILSACGGEEKPRDQPIHLKTWSYAYFTIGQDAQVPFVANGTVYNTEGKVIDPATAKPGDSILVENPDDGTDTYISIIQGDGSITTIKLVKPGHEKCPDWAGNLFAGGCESTELSIVGDR